MPAVARLTPGSRSTCQARAGSSSTRTNGIIGARDLVRVAVARDPRQAIPLQGTFMGAPDAFLGMDVTVENFFSGCGGGDLTWKSGWGFEGLLGGAANADGHHAEHSSVALFGHHR